MKKAVRLLILPLAAALLFLFFARADAPFVSPRGSCDRISGTTAIVTVFVDDPHHNWDFARSGDRESYFRILSRLGTACDWLCRQAKRYGADPVFYWDWHNSEHLYYWYASQSDMRDYRFTYAELRKFITDSVPLETVKEYYRADNVVFLALYNQDINETNGGVSFPWDFSPYAGLPTPMRSSGSWTRTTGVRSAPPALHMKSCTASARSTCTPRRIT